MSVMPPPAPEPAIPFLEARHFTPANRTLVDYIVIHAAEIGESLDGAEALMRGFARQRFLGTCQVCRSKHGGKAVCPNCLTPARENKSSCHYSADADSITQSVRDQDIANHAPGVNPISIGIELSGRARQTAAEWNDDFSRSMLARVAKLSAALCSPQRWDIPIVFVPADGLLRGDRGFTTHSAVSVAFKRSNHTDPGAGWPMDRFLDLVRADSVDTTQEIA